MNEREREMNGFCFLFKIHINCSTKNGSEYYLDSENLQIIYSRKAKLPISKFSMIVTPMKLKTRTSRVKMK